MCSTSKLTEESVVYDCSVKLLLGKFNFLNLRCPLNIRYKQFENSAIILYLPERKFICGCIWILFYLNTISQKRGVSEVTTLICTFKYLPLVDQSLSYIKLTLSVKDYIYMKQHGAYSSKISLKSDKFQITQPKIKQTELRSNVSNKYTEDSVFQHENEHVYIHLIDSKIKQVRFIAYCRD